MPIKYLSPDGDRWKETEPGAMDFVLVLPDGTRKLRKADWYESFGNFAATSYRYLGKRYRGLAKSASGNDTRLPNEDPRPHIFRYKEKD